MDNFDFPVYMKDVRSEDMEALLDFMYRGVVHIPQEALSGLLKTAEGLQVMSMALHHLINMIIVIST